MSSSQSNLSLPKYGYDMVVSVTQASVNATMKEFLDKFNGHQFIMCYSYDDDDNIITTDYEVLKKELGADPFDIPNGETQENNLVQKLDDLGFAFAFRATMGLPLEFDLDEIPNIITLDKGSTMVTYKLVCKEFEILNLNYRRRKLSWSNIQQSEQDKPWVFTFNVNLDLRSSDSAFNKLPPAVQQKVKNLNPDTMFSVQQLYLDLNTAGLESSPEVSGLEPTDTAFIYLNKIFINQYFENLKKQNQSGDNPNGDFLLGYSVQPQEPTKKSSVVPTDLNFMISPYVDAHGVPTKNYDLFTLNYLVMTQNNHMPAPVPFEWNWVDTSQKRDFSGTMAIRKGVFVSYLNTLLAPSLNTISLIPESSVKCRSEIEGVIKPFIYNFDATPDTTPKLYNVINDGTSHVLSYDFNKTSGNKSGFCWGNGSEVKFNYTVTSNIYLESNKVKVITKAIAYVYFEADFGKVDGNLIDYTIETTYLIGVDAYGNFTVTIENGESTITDNSVDLKADAWLEFITVGTIDTFFDYLNEKISSIKTAYVKGFDKKILSMLNGSGVWVFPGGKTFVFKDVNFSKHQDLVTHVTYTDPSSASFKKR